MPSIPKLRPHHLLCTLFFEGKGYSDEFSENMGNIIERISDESVVQIVLTEDDICFPCPNNSTEGCTTKEKVASYDKKVYELCNLKEKEYLYSELKELVVKRILMTNGIEDVCQNCSFSYLCREKVDNVINAVNQA